MKHHQIDSLDWLQVIIIFTINLWINLLINRLVDMSKSEKFQIDIFTLVLSKPSGIWFNIENQEKRGITFEKLY